MMEQGVNQLVKWGVAGWSLVAYVIGFLLATKLFLVGFSPLMGRMPEGLSPEVLAVAIAFTSIPLGFWIYEFYYFIFWAVPMSKAEPAEKDLITRLRSCTQHDIMDDDLIAVEEAWIHMTTRNRNGRRRWWTALIKRLSGRESEDVMRFRNEWSFVRTAWLRAMSRQGADNIGYTRAADRFEFLSSMFDGLGVLRTAVWLGWLMVVGFVLWRIAIEPNGEYVIFGSFVTPLWLALVAETAIAWFLTTSASRVIAANRIMVRSSLLTLANSFICHFECDEHGCRRSSDDD